MAINNWANVTLSGGAAVQPDRADHKNIVAAGTADGGNLTVAWDSAVITRLTLFDSAVATARLIASSRLPP
jgi:hypothetical protein